MRATRRVSAVVIAAVAVAAVVAAGVVGQRRATATTTTTTTTRPAARQPAASTALRALPPAPWWGVTVDDASDTTHVDAIVRGAVEARTGGHPMPVTRVVFDRDSAPSSYQPVVQRLGPVSFLMGELVDSSDMRSFSLASYRARTSRYLAAFGNSIDLWEVGNEVNGEWTGPSSAVVGKVATAYDQVKALGGRTALTLYYNPNCWDRPDHEMFTWARSQLPDRLKQGADVVLISYYEDDCNGYRPTQHQWQRVFDELHAIFPHSALGFGETGTHERASVAHKQDTMQRYYGLRIDGDNYVGGYFWWYYAEDCLPPGRAPLWQTLMSVAPRR